MKNEIVVFEGQIGEVVNFPQPDGRKFEQYRRPPGTRLVILSPEGKILITREYRHETGDYDLRLPGGKVCDSLKEYKEFLGKDADLLSLAEAAAKKEALEETGLIVQNIEFLAKANAGATVEWDLYYFLVKNYSDSSAGQELELGEDIEINWMSPSEIKEAVVAGKMQEWRSVGILLGIVFPKLNSNK